MTVTEVATMPASEVVLPRTLEVTGDLRADAQVDLAAEIDGRVLAATFERGHTVRAGELLVQLDAEDATNRLVEAEALAAQIRERLQLAGDGAFDPEHTPEVRSARITMERAEIEARRYERVVESGAVSGMLHDQKRASWLEAKERYEAEVARARDQFRALQAQQARVAQARRTVADTRITAPWAGTVMVRHVDAGQFVRRGERLLTLTKVDVLRVVLQVPEHAAAGVRRGQRLELAVRSRPGETFAAEVTHLAPGLEPSSRALTVEALVDNAAGRLQPGAFATARLELPGSRPSTMVPSLAVVAERGSFRVVTVDGDQSAWRYVQVGRTAGDATEIVRGLAAGEMVVVANAAAIPEGARIATCVAKEQ